MVANVYIALLRAVNLGGATRVSMASLRDRLAQSGLEDVRTILQSGNVVFRSPSGNAAAVERSLNSKLAPSLGARTEFFVRSRSEWSELVAQNPFPREAEIDPGHLLVAVLRDAPPPTAWRDLQAAIPGREQVRGAGRHGYIVYPDGVGRSKVTPTFIETRLGTRSTSRNWNTVRKLEALAAE
jgi:uncharacterized protein (DUF1697 family)